jgi:predicted RND superfamily exporter protein
VTPTLLLARGGRPWLVLVALVSLLLGWRAAGIGIEHDNASLNAIDADQRRVYDEFKATFGNDEDLLLTVTHPALLEPAGLATVDRVTKTIAGWSGVRHVWSLTTVEELVHGDAGAEPRLLIAPPLAGPDVAARARAAVDRNPDFTGWLVSADRRTAGLVVEIEDRPDDVEYRTRLIESLRALIATEGKEGVELHLTGVPVQKHDVSAYVDRDQRLLLPLAIVVLGATLAAFFRSVAGVVLPLGAAALTVVWTMGVYAASGHALNAITSLLPPVLLVVALITGVHVYEVWREGEHGGDGGADRAARAARAIWVPAVLCTVTTAQGFLSLATSEIPGVVQFGVFAAIGTVIACILGLTAVPAVLAILHPPPRTSGSHGATLRFLDATSGLATSRPGAVLAVFAAITAVAAVGIPLVRANTDLVGFLRKDAPLRRDTEFVDAHLAGTLPLDFVVRRRDGAPVLSLDGAHRLAALEDAVRARPNVTTVTSVLALAKSVHRAETEDGTPALPDDADVLGDELDLLDESGHDLVRRFASSEFRLLRLAVRVRAIGTAESAPLVAAIEADAARILGTDYACTPTGALYHVVHDSTRLVSQQVSSFAMAIALVVLAIGLLFRSLTFTVLALIPNVMPIVWTAGLMGFSGIELSTGTAMIASAVLGMVVDDTIYYLAHFRHVHDGDVVAAIRATIARSARR